MKHIIEAESFRLCFEFESELNMTVNVNNDGFSAKGDIEIDIREFADFAEKLLNVYNTLSGTATLKENYGYQKYISFSADKNGYITVKGFLCDDMKNNEFYFTKSFDQTYLKEFSQELFSTYSR